MERHTELLEKASGVNKRLHWQIGKAADAQRQATSTDTCGRGPRTVRKAYPRNDLSGFRYVPKRRRPDYEAFSHLVQVPAVAERPNILLVAILGGLRRASETNASPRDPRCGSPVPAVTKTGTSDAFAVTSTKKHGPFLRFPANYLFPFGRP